MEREKIVVDASVVVKWFANEEHTDKALQILNQQVSGEIVLLAPDLLLIEVINALRYKKNDVAKLTEVNNVLEDVQINFFRASNTLLKQAIKEANKHDLTIYDALYVALAHRFGAELITADKKVSKVPGVTLLE